ncbi:MAG TPA: hypothetical protein VGK10_07370 [Prolixibacteraceae bacterium]|jgi:ZIP family zinc transporter
MIFIAIPLWMNATLWGLVSGSALILGGLMAYFKDVPKKLIAFIMAIGSGVLISALAFNLMDEAFKRGGFDSTAIGFVLGAGIYSIANHFINKKGAKHRKRSGKQQAREDETAGSGLAIALGSLLDGIPESIAIGISMLEGGVVSFAAVVAIFLSNIPESLSSTSGMKENGRTPKYIFGIWIGITLLSGLASFCGYTIFKNFSPEVIAATIAVAAGAILAMLSETMMPEAFEEGHDYIGVVTVLGFLAGFILTKSGG